jgi:hypothetical protein
LFHTPLPLFLFLFLFLSTGFRSGIEAARHALQDFSIPLLPVPTARVQPLHWIYRGTTSHARFAAPPEDDDDDDDDSAKKGHVVQDGCHSPVAHNFSYRVWRSLNPSATVNSYLSFLPHPKYIPSVRRIRRLSARIERDISLSLYLSFLSSI